MKRYVRHWVGIGPHPMPTILKRSTNCEINSPTPYATTGERAGWP